jgi:hypothetical protein
MNLISLAENLTADEANDVAALTLAVANLRRRGIVATVEQVPEHPPAMGRYAPTVTVRRAIDHNAEAAKRGGYLVEQSA